MLLNSPGERHDWMVDESKKNVRIMEGNKLVVWSKWWWSVFVWLNFITKQFHTFWTCQQLWETSYSFEIWFHLTFSLALLQVETDGLPSCEDRIELIVFL